MKIIVVTTVIEGKKYYVMGEFNAITNVCILSTTDNINMANCYPDIAEAELIASKMGEEFIVEKIDY